MMSNVPSSSKSHHALRSLLVFIDAATGQLMELRFVEVELAFDYFAAFPLPIFRFGFLDDWG